MRFPFFRLQVRGESMLPTFSPGQFLISFNWFLKLEQGDLLVVRVRDKLMVKRLQKIRDHQFFVIGDNPEESTDSRQFGWISKEQIVGKVIFKYN